MAMAAQLRSDEVTPTEDDYVDRMTTTKEYGPGTCCVATVKTLGEGCRAVDGSNAPSGGGANQGLQIVANVSFLAAIAGVS